jgi:hypothetical protein
MTNTENSDISDSNKNKKIGVLQKFIPISSSIVGLVLSDVNELVLVYYEDSPKKYHDLSLALTIFSLIASFSIALIEIWKVTCKCIPKKQESGNGQVQGECIPKKQESENGQVQGDCCCARFSGIALYIFWSLLVLLNFGNIFIDIFYYLF